MKNIKKNLIDSDIPDERKYRAPALEKGLDILELLAVYGAPMTTSQMAVTLERSVSELFRMVLALEYRGYITSSSGAREGYALTNKLFTLGVAQESTRTLLEAALPAIKELTLAIGQSCHMVVASGDQIVVVAGMESPRDPGFSVRPGCRHRLIDTNPGLLLFGCATPEVQAHWLPHLQASANAAQVENFLGESLVAAARGYIQSSTDLADGVTELCVPILSRQGAVATLSVPFLVIKTRTVTQEQVLERLKAVATGIARVLSDWDR